MTKSAIVLKIKSNWNANTVSIHWTMEEQYNVNRCIGSILTIQLKLEWLALYLNRYKCSVWTLQIFMIKSLLFSNTQIDEHENICGKIVKMVRFVFFSNENMLDKFQSIVQARTVVRHLQNCQNYRSIWNIISTAKEISLMFIWNTHFGAYSFIAHRFSSRILSLWMIRFDK